MHFRVRGAAAASGVDRRDPQAIGAAARRDERADHRPPRQVPRFRRPLRHEAAVLVEQARSRRRERQTGIGRFEHRDNFQAIALGLQEIVVGRFRDEAGAAQRQGAERPRVAQHRLRRHDRRPGGRVARAARDRDVAAGPDLDSWPRHAHLQPAADAVAILGLHGDAGGVVAGSLACDLHQRVRRRSPTGAGAPRW